MSSTPLRRSSTTTQDGTSTPRRTNLHRLNTDEANSPFFASSYVVASPTSSDSEFPMPPNGPATADPAANRRRRTMTVGRSNRGDEGRENTIEAANPPNGLSSSVAAAANENGNSDYVGSSSGHTASLSVSRNTDKSSPLRSPMSEAGASVDWGASWNGFGQDSDTGSHPSNPPMSSTSTSFSSLNHSRDPSHHHLSNGPSPFGPGTRAWIDPYPSDLSPPGTASPAYKNAQSQPSSSTLITPPLPSPSLMPHTHPPHAASHFSRATKSARPLTGPTHFTSSSSWSPFNLIETLSYRLSRLAGFSGSGLTHQSPLRSKRFGTTSLIKLIGVIAVLLILGWAVKDRVAIQRSNPEILRNPEQDPEMALLPPRPPRLKGVGRRRARPPTFTYDELVANPAYNNFDPRSVSLGVILHVPIPLSGDQSFDLLLHRLVTQTLRPSQILVIAPQPLAATLQAPDDWQNEAPLIISPYPVAMPPAFAVVSKVKEHMPFVQLMLYLESRDPLESILGAGLLEHFVRVSNTPPFTSSLLTTNGIFYPFDLNSNEETAPPTPFCKSRVRRTRPVHVPSSPLLFQASWLDAIAISLRGDVPAEAAIALSLQSKSSIGSFAIPVDSEGSEAYGSNTCQRLLAADERTPLASTFLHEALLQRAQRGRIAVFVSGPEELDIVYPLACGLATSKGKEVRVFVAGMDDDGLALFTSSFDPDEHWRCRLDVRPLDHAGLPEGRVSRLVQERVAEYEVALFADGNAAEQLDVAIYFVDGRDDGEIELGLRRAGGAFGRRSPRNRWQREDGFTAIGLPRNEVEYMEWMAMLPVEALIQWHKPQIDLAVITDRRPFSLNRLLISLQNTHYFNDEVRLSINLDQTADRATATMSDDLDWPFGPTTLRHRVLKGGLLPSIIESWYPSNNDTYGVLLEDDVEVSPFFYSWLKFSILFYRYTTQGRFLSKRMFGVSLYAPRNVELRWEGRRPFDAGELFESLSIPSTMPYLSQVPCSWGAAYFPEQWREFHNYLALRLSEVAIDIGDTVVADIRSNKWMRSWKKYFIEMVYMRGYVMMYPNYPNFTSFSTNHVEEGTHNRGVDPKRKGQYEVPLMDLDWSLLDHLPDGRLPDYDELPVVDFWGVVTTSQELVERGWQAINSLASCPYSPRGGPVTYNAKELLCPRRHENYEIEEPPTTATPTPTG